MYLFLLCNWLSLDNVYNLFATQILLENKLQAAITGVQRELPSGYLVNPGYERKYRKKKSQNTLLAKRTANSYFLYWCFVLVT